MNSASPGPQSYFLSYSRADETWALRFATDLRERGISMWVDQLDIRPSEHWDRAIEHAVHGCRGLVVILSPRSVQSDNVADEISFAIDHRKSVLPVMIERCRLPLRITRMQVIDATAGYERALDQCVSVLSGASDDPDRLQQGLGDAAAIATAKTRLTDFLGPIAAILVDREAARSADVGELYRRLGEHIESKSERERFTRLGSKPAEASPATPPRAPVQKVQRASVPNAEVNRLAMLLTPYLGPISMLVAQRESATAASLDQLQERLAGMIPNERERANFLRKARSS